MSAFLPNDDLVFLDPVPSDIEVSQSITPAPINKVAEVTVYNIPLLYRFLSLSISRWLN